ncbi:MAG: hypothetical protein KDE53_40000 [Caldilineaceae bacterium]|nr:hypothetical protein [Caldilineaceae bacterium]
MIEESSYRSFMVRWWCEYKDGAERWRGEVEQIQSGAVCEVAALTELVSLIEAAVAGLHPGPDATEVSAVDRNERSGDEHSISQEEI